MVMVITGITTSWVLTVHPGHKRKAKYLIPKTTLEAAVIISTIEQMRKMEAQ